MFLPWLAFYGGSRPLFAGQEIPQFSPVGGAYPTDLRLSVSDPKGVSSVRFTLNSDPPDFGQPQFPGALSVSDRSSQSNVLSMIPGTATVNQHTDGWKPPKGLVPKATVVRAQLWQQDLAAGPPITHTYFVGYNPMSAYRLPVVSISVATNGLFNYQTGIYMLGKVFDDYVRAHPGEALTGHTPANYTQRGPEWEQPGYLEWFEPDGRRMFAQSVRIDIQGQSSRSFRQKSLGLKPLDDGISPGAFHYPFFPGLTNRAGVDLGRFDRLRLSNSGNDWAYTLMRDALCHELAKHTRIDTLAYRPTVVILDGEFWGIHNLREQQDEDYLSAHYDLPSSEVVICQNAGELLQGNPGDERHYQTLTNYVATQDISQPAQYAKVGTWMDLENFATYQASEIYFGNADWPHNNIRFWRLRTPTFQPDAPYGQDGRWRWLLFDVDLGYGHAWSGGVSENSLAYAMAPGGRLGTEPHWSTLLFRRLLLNTEFRNLFINTMADLLNSSFRESRATNVVNEIQSWIAPAIPDHVRRWRMLGDSTNAWRSEVNTLRLFAAQRPSHVRLDMVQQFHLPGFSPITLDCDPRGAGELQINSLRLQEQLDGVVSATNLFPWRGTYFRTVPIQVEAKARPGYRFIGWKGMDASAGSPLLRWELNGPTNLVAQFERWIAPHRLSDGPFRLSEWSRNAAAGSYPPHMLFEQTLQKDPGLETRLTDEWKGAYQATSRSRIVGLDDLGIGFVNTSDPQSTSGSGYLGSAVLALSTLGASNIWVSWLASTMVTNEQVYALRLQWAEGDGGFQDVLDGDGKPVEYVRKDLAGQLEILGPHRLPSQAEQREFIRIRWKYYRKEPGSGPRAFLRLDDIYVTSQSGIPLSPHLELGATNEQAGSWYFRSQPRSVWKLESSTDLKTWRENELKILTDLDGLGVIERAVSSAEPLKFWRLRSP